MVLCELSEHLGITHNFVSIYALVVALAWTTVLLLSSIVFYVYYANPTYESWRYKSEAKFPSPAEVKEEIKQMLKGSAVSALNPTIALYFMWNPTKSSLFKTYCGIGTYGTSWLYLQGFIIFFASDLYEFLYHLAGHKIAFFWKQHKFHHQFKNPSPFAVVADDYIDQFFRSLPLTLFPLLMPTNMDVMFMIYLLLFYCYGVYLHLGFEFDWPNAHHPWINTSFQHFVHHARAGLTKPYHCGFFVKFWDIMFGSTYDKSCICAKCQREEGKRSKKLWEQVEKPDYGVLLSPTFWWTSK